MKNKWLIISLVILSTSAMAQPTFAIKERWKKEGITPSLDFQKAFIDCQSNERDNMEFNQCMEKKGFKVPRKENTERAYIEATPRTYFPDSK